MIKGILACSLLSFSLFCGNCGDTHKVVEFGTVIAMQDGLISIKMTDGNIYDWYEEESSNFTMSDKVVALGCRIFKIK